MTKFVSSFYENRFYVFQRVHAKEEGKFPRCLRGEETPITEMWKHTQESEVHLPNLLKKSPVLKPECNVLSVASVAAYCSELEGFRFRRILRDFFSTFISHKMN